jgi:amphiphysin
LITTWPFIWSFALAEATREGLPPGVLYRVRATYRYQKEDVDELSFDVGEIIQVVEFDDQEDQVT